ncbi:MAG: TIGR00266 family protein [Aquificae bacterium]|nr:TIGR00266 family protein [Aquificota bacterium]
MPADQIDYRIYGDDLQFVEIELDKGESVIAEAGAMVYMEDGIEYEAVFGDGSSATGFFGKLFNAGKRLITGESLFLTKFTNGAGGKRKVAFSGSAIGKIIPVNLKEYGGSLICQNDAFLCAALGIQVDIYFNTKFGVGLFGGEGFILQKISGDGLAFIHAGGSVVEKELKNETIYVDTGCLVAFTEGVAFDIKRAGNLKTMLFGGEGLFLAKLSGQGKVFIQSYPFSRLADRIISHAPSIGGDSKGEGSILGGLGDIFEADD